MLEVEKKTWIMRASGRLVFPRRGMFQLEQTRSNACGVLIQYSSMPFDKFQSSNSWILFFQTSPKSSLDIEWTISERQIKRTVRGVCVFMQLRTRSVGRFESAASFGFMKFSKSNNSTFLIKKPRERNQLFSFTWNWRKQVDSFHYDKRKNSSCKTDTLYPREIRPTRLKFFTRKLSPFLGHM